MTVWRFNYRDKKYETKLSDIFESKVRDQVEIPADWLENVKTYSYSPNTSFYNGHGSYNPHGRTVEGVTVNGKPYHRNRVGSGAYIGLGSHFGNFHDDDDVVPGPQDFQSKKAEPQKENESRKDLCLPSNFWGLTGNEGDDLLTAAERRMLGQSMIDPIDDDNVLDPVGDNGAVISNDTIVHTFELMETIKDSARFDEVAVMHGEKTALSFCAISEMMSDLDQTPLLQEAVTDMVGMMTADDRVQVLKDVFNSLPERHKMGIQTNGL